MPKNPINPTEKKLIRRVDDVIQNYHVGTPTPVDPAVKEKSAHAAESLTQLVGEETPVEKVEPTVDYSAWDAADTKTRHQLALDYIKDSLREQLAAIESGENAGEWRTPWNEDFGLPKNADTGNTYQQSNVLTLQLASRILEERKGDSDVEVTQIFGTARQWDNSGYRVKKGQKSCGTIIRPVFGKKKVKNAVTGKEEEEEFFAWKYHAVFNSSQVADADGNAYVYEKPFVKDVSEVTTEIENLVNKINIPIEHEIGVSPNYRFREDKIVMPPAEAFENHTQYLTAVIGQIAQAVGHKDRTNQHEKLLDGGFSTADHKYAQEKLVGEMTAVMVMQNVSEFVGARFGAPTDYAADHAKNHAQYIHLWLEQMDKNPTYFVKASGAAQKRADFILEQMGILKPKNFTQNK